MNNVKIINDAIYNFVKDIKCETIIGEVIENKISSVHHYITIKNDDYIIKCNSWGKTYKIKNGNMVKINGSMSFMNKSFTLYYNIKTLEIIEDIGIKLNEYDLLKLKLTEERIIGNKKKELFKFPYNIGLITANNSAVIKDMMTIFIDEKFIGNLFLKNSIMQGDSCPSSIINSIKYFNELKNVDLIIIFRGGGSSEDLEAFNNYEMMKNINKSDIVIYCAIGHASDTTQLINFASDKSFGTPSIVSNYIIEEQRKYYDEFNKIKDYLNIKINKFVEYKKKFNKINLKEKMYIFNNKEIERNINMFKNKFNNILIKYEKYKNILSVKTQILQPIISKKNKAITTLEEFNMGFKKLKISFIDGDVEIQYKII